MTRNKLVLIFASIFIVLITVFTLKYCKWPFAWIYPAYSLYCCVLIAVSHQKLKKYLLTPLSLFILLSLFELFLVSKAIQFKRLAHGKNAEPDLRTGWRLATQSKRKVQIYHGDELLVSCTMSTDEYGCRTTRSPYSDTNYTSPPIMFLGCSFTFGLNVNDEETLPSQFEKFSNGEFRAVNYGMPGAGPHHMLALLELDMESAALCKQRPELAIYTLINDHALRCAGRALSWEENGPSYDFSTPPIRNGLNHSPFFMRSMNQIRKSLALRSILKILYSHPQRSDLKFCAHLLKGLQTVLNNKYQCELLVNVWSHDGSDSSMLKEMLSSLNIPYFETSDILPSSLKDCYLYDGHPSPLAYSTVGSRLAYAISESPHSKSSTLTTSSYLRVHSVLSKITEQDKH